MSMQILFWGLIIFKYFLAVLFIIVLAYISLIMFSFKNLVPFVPTSKRVAKKMVELAQIKDYEKVCDLGSGSGTIILQAAKRHKKNWFVGIERSFFLRFWSKSRLLFHPFLRKRLQIISQDFFNTKLAVYDVVFCFITPNALRILGPRFLSLKKGSRVICYMFSMENHENFSEKIFHLTAKDSIYVYKKLN